MMTKDERFLDETLSGVPIRIRFEPSNYDCLVHHGEPEQPFVAVPLGQGNALLQRVKKTALAVFINGSLLCPCLYSFEDGEVRDGERLDPCLVERACETDTLFNSLTTLGKSAGRDQRKGARD